MGRERDECREGENVVLMGEKIVFVYGWFIVRCVGCWRVTITLHNDLW